MTSLGMDLQGKNIEVEQAVEDLLQVVQSFPLNPAIPGVTEADANNLRTHYNHFMFQALLSCSKGSLNALKKRVASRQESTIIFLERPFFEVDVQLAAPDVKLIPDPKDVQAAMNKCAVAVLGFNKTLYDWGQKDVPVRSPRIVGAAFRVFVLMLVLCVCRLRSAAHSLSE